MDAQVSAQKELVKENFNVKASQPAMRLSTNGAQSSPMLPGPPPLKRMPSASSSQQNSQEEEMSENDSLHIDESPSGSSRNTKSSTSLFSLDSSDDSSVSAKQPQLANGSKKSSLDSLIGKIKAKSSTSVAEELIPRAADSMDCGQAAEEPFIKPPPLQLCASPSFTDASKSRRKQTAPRSAADQPTAAEPTAAESKAAGDWQISDVDTMLLSDCEIVHPVELPVDEDMLDGEEDASLTRISRKGRVVKRPFWADSYTDNTSTEDDWTPERPGTDRSRTSHPPPQSVVKNKLFTIPTSTLKHEDLNSVLICDSVDPKWLVPFKLGWLRELVIRNPAGDDNMATKCNADAYYYTPETLGRIKLRSLVKVEEYLSDHNVPSLHGSNFTFMKRAIFKPPGEFVRLAGKTGKRPLTVKKTNISTPKPTPVKKTSPAKTPQTSDTSRKRQSSSPRISPSKKIRGDRDAVQRAKSFLQQSKPVFKVVAPAGKPPASLQKIRQPCSDQCANVRNKLPSLQCGVCLLLYHPECVNWATTNREALFVCSTCIHRSSISPRCKLPADELGLKIMNVTSTSKKVNSEVPADIKPQFAKQLIVKSTSTSTSLLSADKDLESQKAGRLITIPLAVLQKIDTKAPFALKLNNETYRIEPSRLMKTPTGVKILITNDQVMKKPIKPATSKTVEAAKSSSAALSSPNISVLLSQRETAAVGKDTLMSQFNKLPVASSNGEMDCIQSTLNRMVDAITQHEQQLQLSKAAGKHGKPKDLVVKDLNRTTDTRLSLKGKTHSSMSEVLYEAAQEFKANDKKNSNQQLYPTTIPTDNKTVTNSKPVIPLAPKTVSAGPVLLNTPSAAGVIVHPMASQQPQVLAIQNHSLGGAAPIRLINSQPTVTPLLFTQVTSPVTSTIPLSSENLLPLKPSKPPPTKLCMHSSSQTENESRQRSSMVGLSAGYDLLTHVFGYLSLHDLMSVSLVCKVWRCISQQNWRTVSVGSETGLNDGEKFCSFLTERNTKVLKLKNLSQEKCNSLTFDLVTVTELRLTSCPLDDSLLTRISNSMPKLKTLEMVAMTTDDSNCVNFDSLAKLRRLEELTIYPLNSISALGVQEIFSLPALQSLIMRNVTSENISSVDQLSCLGELFVACSSEWLHMVFPNLLCLPNLAKLTMDSCPTQLCLSTAQSSLRHLKLTDVKSAPLNSVLSIVGASLNSLCIMVTSVKDLPKTQTLQSCAQLTLLDVQLGGETTDEAEYIEQLYSSELPNCQVKVQVSHNVD